MNTRIIRTDRIKIKKEDKIIKNLKAKIAELEYSEKVRKEYTLDLEKEILELKTKFGCEKCDNKQASVFTDNGGLKTILCDKCKKEAITDIANAYWS